MRVGDVSQALNTLVAGQEATTFNEGTDQYDVYVRAINTYRTDVEGLKRMIVPSSKVGWVTLDTLVKVSEGTGPSSVDRTNRQRQVTLLANTKPGGSATSITSEINNFVKDAESAAGIYDRLCRPIEGDRQVAVLLCAGDQPVVHFYVHRAGGAVRIVYPPDDDPADAAALDTVRYRQPAGRRGRR